MTNAPERIWIEDEFGEGDDDQWTYGTWDVRNYAGYDVEYVRADIVQALTADFARQVQRTDEQREAYEQALSVMEAERDEALECNEEFFVDNQFLKKRVEETRKEWEGWQSASVKLMKQVTALTAERDRMRKALEDIIADCEAAYPPSHGAIKYAAKLALKGETP